MAVLTVAAFLSKWEALFPTTGNREITASRMRDFRQDIADSFQPVAGQTTVESWKSPCAVATTGNITLSGEQTIDGVLTSASRVLVKNQTTTSQNGIYVSAAGAWSRSTDANEDAELEGAAVGVTQGTTQQNTVWLQTSDNITLGSTAIAWQQIGFGFSGISGSTGATDNAILRADGTGGSTLQASAVTITDAGVISNVTDPSNAQDAATKNYVDTFVNDTDIKHFESSDWISSNSANGKDWTISGSGLAVSNYGVNGTEKAFGIVALTTSTSSTGSTFFSKGGSISAPGLILGNHSIKYRNRLALENLSDGTETYSATNGFSDDLTSPTPNNCVMFRYRHSVNGGRWEAVCASGGTETATDTGVTADTLFSIFDIRINQSGTSCTFYINGSLVATITTNIPSVTMTLKFGILKSAGTTARLLVSDWYDLLITRTTAR